ncbi:MAG: septum formation initiator family protein [Chloroflexi bacterium]|nr:septum formation initiator family protein [Chloroflexota bacterium]
MTSLDLPARRRTPPDRPLRVRIPTSRGGLAWIAVLLIIGIFLAVQVGRQVYSSWSIGQEADAIRAEITAMEAHNEALRQELAYLQSKGFVSAEARRLLNLGLPGEHVLIIPPGAETALPPELRKKPVSTPPLEQWLDLFFGP